MKLYQSPFDNGYINVPDVSNYNNTNLRDTFIANFKHFLERSKSPINVTPLLAKSFCPNDEATINVNYYHDTADLYDYNYAIIGCETGDGIFLEYYYFINNIQAINSTNAPTLVLSLQKDIWTTYYQELARTPYAQNILRRHVSTEFVDGYNVETILTNENVVDKNVQSTRTIKLPVRDDGYLDDFDILWVRYKLNPTVDFYYIEEESSELLPKGKSNYGVFTYLYYPIAVYQGIKRVQHLRVVDKYGEVHNYDLINGTFPRVESNNVVAVDLTFYPPFRRLNEGYDADSNTFSFTTNWDIGSIFYGQTQEPFGAKLFFNDASMSERTYTRVYTFDYSNYASESVIASNWYERLPFAYYPYKAYYLRLPSGEVFPILSKTLLKSLTINITPTDSSLQYSFEVIDVLNRVIYSRETTRGFSESSGEIPITVDAYKNFLATASLKYDTDVAYKKDLYSLQLYRNTFNNTMDIGKNAVNFATAKKPSVGIHSLMNIAKTGGNIAFDIGEYGINTQYVEDMRDLTISELQHVVGNNPSPSSDLSDKVFQDRFILYEETFIPYKSLEIDYHEFRFFGFNEKSRDVPLRNCREKYDYVLTDSVTQYEQIKNPTHRNVIESIFVKGVRKWHLDKIYTNDALAQSLNKSVYNPCIY